MASTCGSTLALMDAGVPIKAPVAGAAMGLVLDGETGNFVVLTDILGKEDSIGDMDFKVTGTTKGITALQMDIKVKGIDERVIREGLKQALAARLFILDKMTAVLPSRARGDVRLRAADHTIKINPEKIREIIGKGGSMIRKIQEETSTEINVEDDGTVEIAAVSGENSRKAINWIESLTREVEVGALYLGKVTRLMNFGAFVEILPGKEGLVRIGELADYHVPSVEDVVSVGDEVMVVVMEIDRQGRVNLSPQGGDAAAPRQVARALASTPRLRPRHRRGRFDSGLSPTTPAGVPGGRTSACDHPMSDHGQQCVSLRDPGNSPHPLVQSAGTFQRWRGVVEPRRERPGIAPTRAARRPRLARTRTPPTGRWPPRSRRRPRRYLARASATRDRPETLWCSTDGQGGRARSSNRSATSRSPMATAAGTASRRSSPLPACERVGSTISASSCRAASWSPASARMRAMVASAINRLDRTSALESRFTHSSAACVSPRSAAIRASTISASGTTVTSPADLELVQRCRTSSLRPQRACRRRPELAPRDTLSNRAAPARPRPRANATPSRSTSTAEARPSITAR